VAALHRHQLVQLTCAGWRAVLDRPHDDEARACIEHWARQRLPLVVTRQSTHAHERGELDIGLSAPSRWSRRRLSLRVRHTEVACFGEFPSIQEVACEMHARTGHALHDLSASLAVRGVRARVYGSHGWQLLTGLTCVHARSDIDLWSAVSDAAHADAVTSALQAYPTLGVPRLDGELLFPDGRAVAWREWQAWRSGRCRALMVKTLTGASLVESWASAVAEPEEARSC
jgi:phosphoribosyl-dephospho-CoA transferase